MLASARFARAGEKTACVATRDRAEKKILRFARYLSGREK
jgi:hypothetical protein